MTTSNFERFESEQTKLLGKSALVTILIGAAVLILLFVLTKSSLSLRRPVIVEAPFLEAELVPREKEQPKLHEAKPAASAVVQPEVSVSTKLNKGKESKNEMKQVLEAPNQTVPGSSAEIPSHGPLVDYAPTPKLPSYLKDQNLKTSILIEFLISAQGAATPNLIGTSGNEELDALALKSARSWVFRPAKKEGQPIDSKVRLRINFEVE